MQSQRDFGSDSIFSKKMLVLFLIWKITNQCFGKNDRASNEEYCKSEENEIEMKFVGDFDKKRKNLFFKG